MERRLWKKLIFSLAFSFFVSASFSWAEAALRLGDTGAEVEMLQQALSHSGLEIGEVDGIFGSQTYAAVITLQNEFDIEPDGIVGEETWNILRTGGKIPVSRSADRNAVIRNRIVSTALRYLSVPYVWGGTTPEGFDCSGFVQFIYAMQGVSLPRTADMQFEAGTVIQSQQLQPGDIVYFSTYAPGPSHNGIYIGVGRFISATSSRGIVVDRLDSSYWSARYIGAQRVVR